MFDSATTAETDPSPSPSPSASSAPFTCPVCEAGFTKKRTANQVTCGARPCSRAWATRHRPLFRKRAVARACAVCGVEYTPKRAEQNICRNTDDAGKLSSCARKAQQIRWYRAALDPDVALAYAMKVETVRARLDELLAGVHARVPFEKPCGSRRPRKASLAGTPVIAVTEAGEDIHATPDGGEVIAQVCEICGDPFAGKPGTCSKATCRKGKRAKRSAAWYAVPANRERHIATTIAARKRRTDSHVASPTPPAELATLHAPPAANDVANPPPADPWALPAPSFGAHLPATAVPIALSPPRTLNLEHVNALHASITYALDRPHGNLPDWSLSLVGRDVSPSCVVACFRSPADVERLRAAPWPVRLGPVEHQAVAARPWSAQLKAPPPSPPGRYRVRLDTVTPVVIKRSVRTEDRRPHGRNVHHVRPVASNLVSTLALTLAPRVGVAVLAEHLAVEIVETHAEPSRDVLRGGPRIRMHAAGWEGHLVLEVNAVALWLLECAARGMGLGGRVAFGFGQVRVTRLPAAPADEPPPLALACPVDESPLVPVRRDVVEDVAAVATPPARRVGAYGARAPGVRETVAPPPPLLALEDLPAVTTHAIEQYALRVRKLARVPASWVERGKLRDELAALVALSHPSRPDTSKNTAHRLADPWLWTGPRIGGAKGARLRLVVGRSTAPETIGNLVVATVLPLFDPPAPAAALPAAA